MNKENLLDQMCAITFTRHAGLPTKEFLKRIGKKKAESEEIAIREGKMGLFIGCTKQLLKLNNTLQAVTGMQKLLKGEKKMQENNKKVEKSEEIDTNAKKQMKRNVDLGLSSVEEMNRTELNALCEIYSLLEKVVKSAEEISSEYASANASKINAFLQKEYDSCKNVN